jgi:hypothetical protein
VPFGDPDGCWSAPRCPPRPYVSSSLLTRHPGYWALNRLASTSGNTLSRKGLDGSIGRIGACGDHAAMESFFRPYATQYARPATLATRAERRLAIVTWIERTARRRRRQRALGRLTLLEFELFHTSRNRVLKFTPSESTELGAVPFQSAARTCVDS